MFAGVNVQWFLHLLKRSAIPEIQVWTVSFPCNSRKITLMDHVNSIFHTPKSTSSGKIFQSWLVFSLWRNAFCWLHIMGSVCVHGYLLSHHHQVLLNKIFGEFMVNQSLPRKHANYSSFNPYKRLHEIMCSACYVADFCHSCFSFRWENYCILHSLHSLRYVQNFITLRSSYMMMVTLYVA